MLFILITCMQQQGFILQRHGVGSSILQYCNSCTCLCASLLAISLHLLPCVLQVERLQCITSTGTSPLPWPQQLSKECGSPFRMCAALADTVQHRMVHAVYTIILIVFRSLSSLQASTGVCTTHRDQNAVIFGTIQSRRRG